MVIEVIKDVNIYTSQKIIEDNKEYFKVVFKGYIAKIENINTKEVIFIGLLEDEITINVDIKNEKIYIHPDELYKPLVAKFENKKRLFLSVNFLLTKEQFIKQLIVEINKEFNSDNEIVCFENSENEEEYNKELMVLFEDIQGIYKDKLIDYYLEHRDYENLENLFK